MPSTKPITDALKAVLLEVDGIDHVVVQLGKQGGTYEKDQARIRRRGGAKIMSYGSHRWEGHKFELLIIIGTSTPDRREKEEIAEERMDEVIDLLESKRHATLGGVVSNVHVSSDGDRDGTGEYLLDSKGSYAAAMLVVETNRLVANNA